MFLFDKAMSVLSASLKPVEFVHNTYFAEDYFIPVMTVLHDTVLITIQIRYTLKYSSRLRLTFIYMMKA